MSKEQAPYDIPELAPEADRALEDIRGRDIPLLLAAVALSTTYYAMDKLKSTTRVVSEIGQKVLTSIQGGA